MAFNIVYKKSVERDLKKIDREEARGILAQIEEDLSSNPRSHPTMKGRFRGLRRYRAGDYRVIYAVIEKDVLVLRIGHRRDIYRK